MVDAVSSATAAATGTLSGASGLGNMGSDAFLKLLVAQLRYQNPMEPSSGTEFLQQTAQFTTVEALQEISRLQQQLMGLEQVSLALGMVGKEVTVATGEAEPLRGVVDNVRFSPDGPVLTVDGVEVSMNALLSVEEGPAESESAADDAITG